MKTVGIISDTHGKLPGEALKALEGCDRVIHAGDVCSPEILWQLECAAPVCAVLGNNDHVDFGPSVHPTASFVEEGVRFVVAHEPRHLKGALEGRRGDDGHKIVAVHGHAHVPKLEFGGSADPYDYLICPGAVNRSREREGRKTLAFVDVDAGCVMGIRIVDLDGDVILSAAGNATSSFD